MHIQRAGIGETRQNLVEQRPFGDLVGADGRDLRRGVADLGRLVDADAAAIAVGNGHADVVDEDSRGRVPAGGVRAIVKISVRIGKGVDRDRELPGPNRQGDHRVWRPVAPTDRHGVLVEDAAVFERAVDIGDVALGHGRDVVDNQRSRRGVVHDHRHVAFERAPAGIVLHGDGDHVAAVDLVGVRTAERSPGESSGAAGDVNPGRAAVECRAVGPVDFVGERRSAEFMVSGVGEHAEVGDVQFAPLGDHAEAADPKARGGVLDGQ